jgi:hypothetical protein
MRECSVFFFFVLFDYMKVFRLLNSDSVSEKVFTDLFSLNVQLHRCVERFMSLTLCPVVAEFSLCSCMYYIHISPLPPPYRTPTYVLYNIPFIFCKLITYAMYICVCVLYTLSITAQRFQQ